MRIIKNSKVFIMVGLSMGLTSLALAQAGNPTPISDGTKDVVDTNPVQFFIGQRLWFATWDESFLDAQIVIPNPANTVPVLQQSNRRAISNLTVLPLTTLGLRYKNWTVSATVMPQTKFSSDGLALGDAIHRDEADISVGYAFSSNLVGSVVYKSGSVDQVATASSTSLTGVGGSYKVKGLLFGVSGSAPLRDSLSLYGTLAFGPARQTVSLTGAADESFNGTYQFSEIGLAYRFANERAVLGVTNWSMQLGYRAQSVTINDLPLNTYSIGPVPTLISTQSRSVQSSTQGLVFGVVAAF